MPGGLLDPVTSRADKNDHARRFDPAVQNNQETG
jgi:hypothetical protein